MAKPRYVVRCDVYETPPRSTREMAERLKESIEKMADCSLPHDIVEVDASYKRRY